MFRVLALLITLKIGKLVELVVCLRKFLQNSINSIVPLAILRVRYFVPLGFISNYILAAVKALATRLLAEDDYKMKCAEYFMSLSDDCKNIELKFPYFNLLFLVGYILLLGIQGICMLRHR